MTKTPPGSGVGGESQLAVMFQRGRGFLKFSILIPTAIIPMVSGSLAGLVVCLTRH